MDSLKMNIFENSYDHPTSSSPLTHLYSSPDLDETIQNQQLVSQKRKAGRTKFKETRHPTYRGVRERENNKWVCEIREPNSKTRIWLGTHATPEKAARAHDVAVLALRGNSAPLNFEDSLWVLPRAKSSSAKDIQSAAAKATRSFPPNSSRKPKNPSHCVAPVHAGRGSNSSSAPVSTFYDDEELYYMPALIANMAEGMLVDPPPEGGYCFGDEHCDFRLWANATD